MKTQKKFSPFLAPNDEANLDTIEYPIFASTKIDGIRCLFIKGEMLSRSLKPIVNKQLREKFHVIAEYSRENNLIIDGEIYSHLIPFQAISSCVMTQDHRDKKAVKKWDELCEESNFNVTREEALDSLKFYCFDCITDDNFDQPFFDRLLNLPKIEMNFQKKVKRVINVECKSKEDIEIMFEEALDTGFEGLILRSKNGRYKCGRGTIKEGLIYKVKPFKTFDGKILEVIQATKVDPNAEKKTNELGRSVTSKRLKDRLPIEKAAAFLVDYEDKQVKVVIAQTDEEKEKIWQDRNSYIGKMVEYKGMMVGAKNVPRHPTMLRFIDPRTK